MYVRMYIFFSGLMNASGEGDSSEWSMSNREDGPWSSLGAECSRALDVAKASNEKVCLGFFILHHSTVGISFMDPISCLYPVMSFFEC
jgi:hypothetical protein